MAKAIYNDTIIASSDDTILLEGTHYFPPETVNMEYLQISDASTMCSWKGTAIYYNVIVAGRISNNAAWSYCEPSKAAVSIKDHVAFGGDVEVLP
jgi:uncharacterized protein (DUF427 family)